MIGSSVRFRLTLWYAAALGGTMALLAAGLYLFVRSDLLGRVKAQTRRQLARVDTLLQRDPAELGELEEYGSVSYYRIAGGSPPGIQCSTGWPPGPEPD